MIKYKYSWSPDTSNPKAVVFTFVRKPTVLRVIERAAKRLWNEGYGLHIVGTPIGEEVHNKFEDLTRREKLQTVAEAIEALILGTYGIDKDSVGK